VDSVKSKLRPARVEENPAQLAKSGALTDKGGMPVGAGNGVVAYNDGTAGRCGEGA
jgi:hypothetical protein